MSDQPQAAGKHYRVGKLRFEHQPNGKWGVSDNCLGVGGHLTPVGALIGLWRWRRRYRKHPPKAQEGSR